MVNLNIYDFNNANKKGQLELKDEIFNNKVHNRAIFDVVIMQRASLRQGTHKTKDKSEVRGGGRKPWKQKGTGRARQGSIRSPHWRGGGVVFGPTPEKNYTKKVNKKVNRLALISMLSKKIKENNIILVDNIELNDHKTKNIKNIIEKHNAKDPLFIVEEDNINLFLSVRNIPNADVLYSSEVKVLDLVSFETIFITKESLKRFEEVLV